MKKRILEVFPLKQIIKEWQHIFKLDPDKEISDHDLEKVCESGTDAIIVGGTDNITEEKILDLLYRLRQYTVPAVLEISSLNGIVPGFDYYFIPTVLNSSNKKWMTDIHHEALKSYRSMVNWDEVFVEGYVILNEESKAYQKTDCIMPNADDVATYAIMAEQMFNLPIFYVEYSGTYGDPDVVKKASSELDETVLIYGGGIETEEQARKMATYADIIVVGNSIYTNLTEALKTVRIKK